MKTRDWKKSEFCNDQIQQYPEYINKHIAFRDVGVTIEIIRTAIFWVLSAFG